MLLKKSQTQEEKEDEQQDECKYDQVSDKEYVLAREDRQEKS